MYDLKYKVNYTVEVIISKVDDNAGVFLTKQELKRLNNQEIKKLLHILYKGFILKFHKKQPLSEINHPAALTVNYTLLMKASVNPAALTLSRKASALDFDENEPTYT